MARRWEDFLPANNTLWTARIKKFKTGLTAPKGFHLQDSALYQDTKQYTIQTLPYKTFLSVFFLCTLPACNSLTYTIVYGTWALSCSMPLLICLLYTFVSSMFIDAICFLQKYTNLLWNTSCSNPWINVYTMPKHDFNLLGLQEKHMC